VYSKIQLLVPDFQFDVSLEQLLQLETEFGEEHVKQVGWHCWQVPLTHTKLSKQGWDPEQLAIPVRVYAVLALTSI